MCVCVCVCVCARARVWVCVRAPICAVVVICLWLGALGCTRSSDRVKQTDTLRALLHKRKRRLDLPIGQRRVRYIQTSTDPPRPSNLSIDRLPFSTTATGPIHLHQGRRNETHCGRRCRVMHALPSHAFLSVAHCSDEDGRELCPYVTW